MKKYKENMTDSVAFLYIRMKKIMINRRMMSENAKKLACEVRKTNCELEENEKKNRHNNGR